MPAKLVCSAQRAVIDAAASPNVTGGADFHRNDAVGRSILMRNLALIRIENLEVRR
jgi:hypothetical protein